MFRWTDEHGNIDKRMLHLRGLLSDANNFVPDEEGDALAGVPLRRATGFRVDGLLDGNHVSAGVFWGGEVGEQVEIRGWPDARDQVLSFLRAHEGEQVPVGDTGETVVLHRHHPLAIRAALAAFGDIDSVVGDDPPGWRS